MDVLVCIKCCSKFLMGSFLLPQNFTSVIFSSRCVTGIKIRAASIEQLTTLKPYLMLSLRITESDGWVLQVENRIDFQDWRYRHRAFTNRMYTWSQFNFLSTEPDSWKTILSPSFEYTRGIVGRNWTPSEQFRKVWRSIECHQWKNYICDLPFVHFNKTKNIVQKETFSLA